MNNLLGGFENKYKILRNIGEGILKDPNREENIPKFL